MKDADEKRTFVGGVEWNVCMSMRVYECVHRYVRRRVRLMFAEDIHINEHIDLVATLIKAVFIEEARCG